MKALSVKQPWASLIARGHKTIEVRTWSTSYRGPLLICASRRPDIDGLPTGVAVCTINLVDVRPITPEDATAACVKVTPGQQFAWVLESVSPLDFDLPITGRLGLFALPHHATILLANSSVSDDPT